MGIALEMTKALFDGIGLKYQMIREDAMSIGFSGLKNMGTIEMVVFFLEDGTVGIGYDCPSPVPEEKMEQLYQLFADLNNKCRFAKFCIGSDRYFQVTYEILASSENVQEIIYHMVHYLSELIDDTYPEIMRIIWSGQA